jgi:ribosomal-protein-alanine N-acetyltransferase
MEILLEDASIRHLDKLYEIEKKCFEKEAFTKQQIAYLLTDYNSISLIVKVNQEIAGFVIGRIDVEKKKRSGHILTIDVTPAYRQQGIAQKLLQGLENIFKEKGIKECRLEVREDNVAALELYRKLGYLESGRLEGYYGSAHGIRFRKTLT